MGSRSFLAAEKYGNISYPNSPGTNMKLSGEIKGHHIVFVLSEIRRQVTGFRNSITRSSGNREGSVYQVQVN